MTPEDQEDVMLMAQRYKELTAERVAISHILVAAKEDAPLEEKNKALERAKSIKKQLDEGAEFYEMAQIYSDDSESKPRGGDMGSFVRGNHMVPEPIEAESFKMEVGAISGPVQTVFGYHLIRLEEKRAQQSLVFERAREELEKVLMEKNARAKLMDVVQDLRSKADIKKYLPK
jgi:parvulin-like peptidyl-prolyl isomerase